MGEWLPLPPKWDAAREKAYWDQPQANHRSATCSICLGAKALIINEAGDIVDVYVCKDCDYLEGS